MYSTFDFVHFLLNVYIYSIYNRCTNVETWFLRLGQSVQGTFPECIWNMPMLSTLQLSSNGIDGNLFIFQLFVPPANLGFCLGSVPVINASSKLYEVNAFGNKLNSIIPASLFHISSLEYLDLSDNKIEGTIPQVLIHAKTVKLATNRLSGLILPDWFTFAEDLNVLEGNHFDCTSHKYPYKDPFSDRYICGSLSTDYSLIIFWSIFGILVMCMLMFCSYYLNRRGSSLIADFRLYYFCDWKSLDKVPHAKRYLLVLQESTRSLCCLGCFLFLCQIIIFPSLKSNAEYSTQKYQYQLLLSAGHVSGIGSVVALFIVGFASILYYSAAVYTSHKRWILTAFLDLLKHTHYDQRRASIFNSSLNMRSKLLILCYMFILCSIIVLIYVGYILLYQIVNSSYELSFLQIFLSIVMLFVDYILMPNSLAYFASYIKLPHLSILTEIRSTILLFNNVVLPVLSITFTSSQCFLSSVRQVAKITASYPLVTCEFRDYDGNCISFVRGLQSLSYHPPDVYNNNCRNELFSISIPVQIITFAVLLVAPIVKYLLLTRIKNPVNFFPPGLMKFFGLIYWPTENYKLPFLFVNDCEGIMMSQNIYIGLVLTYGIISPPLLVAVILTAASDYVMQRILVFRFVSISQDDTALQELDCACSNTSRCLHDFFFPAIIVSCLFQTIFLIDMGGDKNKYIELIWIPLIFFIYIVFIKLYTDTREKNILDDMKTSLALRKSHDIEIPSTTAVAENVHNPVVGNGDSEVKSEENASGALTISVQKDSSISNSCDQVSKH